jgi:hypothetical protein
MQTDGRTPETAARQQRAAGRQQVWHVAHPRYDPAPSSAGSAGTLISDPEIEDFFFCWGVGKQSGFEWATTPHSRGPSAAVMARRRWRRPPGGHATAAGSGGQRAPFSTDIASYTHTDCSLARSLLTYYSSPRPFSNGIFRSDSAPSSFPCARPLLPSSDRSAGQRNQPSHSTVLARPVCPFVCVSAASFSCARPLLPSSDRSAGQRNQPSHSTVIVHPVCPFVCVSAASFPCRFLDLGLIFLLASACCTRAHTLSLDSSSRPTAGKSSSPAGLSTLVYAYVVHRAPASPYTYSSSTQVSR